MFQSDKKANSLGSIMAPEIEIKGDINVSGNLIVYGTVYGNIISYPAPDEKPPFQIVSDH